MALVRGFENGSLDIYRLNFAIITLIPKELHAKEMKIGLLVSVTVVLIFY